MSETGYYSQVAIEVDGEDAPRLDNLCEELGLGFDRTATLSNGHAVRYFEIIKWYDEYPEVCRVSSFLEELDRGYAFVRAGEDSEDVETVYRGYIGLHRHIGLVSRIGVWDECRQTLL